jgi:hypothetical protein
MKPQCIQALQYAAGRALTAAEIKKIDDRISSTMRSLARSDPNGWRAKSSDQRVMDAAAQAMADVQAEAALKVQRAQLQIVKTASMETRVGDLMANYAVGRNKALVHEMELTDSYIGGIRRENLSQMMDLLDAVGSKEGTTVGRKGLMFLFDAENPQMSRDLAAEIFNQANGATGNQLAQKGAKAWLDGIEQMRQRFNAAGGDVGQLDYGYLPQPHDQGRVRGSGDTAARDKWVQRTLPLLDRGRYLLEDGSRMSDVQVSGVLNAAWETIATGGLNKLTPGQGGGGNGARSNAGSESRQIHFKDAESYLGYMGEYGGGSMYDAMLGHIGGMARDIGLVERYGPNPNQQMKLQFDLAKQADIGTKRAFGMKPESYWDVISGKAGMAENGNLAQIAQDVRNIEVFGKLAGAVLSSITDVGTFFVSTGFNKLPYWQAVRNVGKQFDGDTRDFLTMHGIIAETMVSNLNRWSGDNIKNNWSGRLANSTMKLSLMNAWTDTLRRGWSMTMMSGLAKMSKTDWAGLSEWDRSHMGRKGITEADWNVITKANLTEHQGAQFLTPEAIRSIADKDLITARTEDFQRIKNEIANQTTELTARNAQDQQWIKGRIDKYDAARNALNRSVKDLLAGKLKRNEKATEPLLERMTLLEAQREAAQVQADMEADFNRFATQDESRAFLNAVEDGASADKTARGPASKGVRAGLQSAETIGRRYGEAKGRLDRRMKEIENRIAEMDREAHSTANTAGKEAAAKADSMLADLREFIGRSQERQARRSAVIQRLQGDETSRLAAESERIKSEVVAKVLGLITDESEYAVVNPDLATRTFQSGAGTSRGTVRGELARSVMQFKSFPVAMISKHWRRMLDTPQGLEGAPVLANKLMYGASMMVSLTVLGGIAYQMKQITQGKDPVDMTTPKFWTRAMAQGGGLGIVGDFLLTDPTENPGDSTANAIKNVAGPTVGSAFDIVGKLGVENVYQAAHGKDTHLGAETLRVARGHLPYVNLWYAKAALDHAGLHALQENLSPGYLGKMQQRARKDWNQDYWWKPGTGGPDRAPDLSATGGK